MKKLLAIVLVVVLALALSASAFASTTSVPLGRPYVNDDASQAIWSNPEQNAEGNDGYQTDIPWALFKAATSIVITFDAVPDDMDQDLNFIFQSPANWWDQNYVYKYADIFVENDSGGGTVTLPISTFSGYADWSAQDNGKFVLAFWNDALKGGNAVRASLLGVPSDLAATYGFAPSTGAITFIGLAVAALAVSGTGAVVVGRKLKK